MNGRPSRSVKPRPPRSAPPRTARKPRNGATPRRIEGLIFDCDGTLADTMPLHWRAWRTIACRYGLDFSEDRFYALGGVPARDILDRLSREQGIRLDPLTVAKEKEKAYLQTLPQVGPINAVVGIVREHHGRVPLAVASGGSFHVIARVLEHLGILGFFAAIVTSEDVQRQKPAPDIFLEAARRIGAAPDRCRAYEDTDLGLEAIRAAGMEAVDVRQLVRNFRRQ